MTGFAGCRRANSKRGWGRSRFGRVGGEFGVEDVAKVSMRPDGIRRIDSKFKFEWDRRDFEKLNLRRRFRNVKG